MATLTDYRKTVETRCGSAPADCFSTHSLLLCIRESLLSGFDSKIEAGTNDNSNDFLCQHEVGIP